MQTSGLKSNIEWKQWGKADPLFAVASWSEKQKGGASPWTEDEFYALGQSDWRDFWSQWQQYGVNSGNCLEIGCGAGRITKQLATSFQKVFAVDVSEEMIDRARKAVAANVEFTVIDGIHLPQPDASIKAVFSAHVLQHLDNCSVGYAYFREFYRVLDFGGTLMVHLPLHMYPRNPLMQVMRGAYAWACFLSDTRAAIKRRLGVKLMRGTSYSVVDLYDVLLGIGFQNIEFRIFSVKSNGDPHSFILATK